MNTELLNQGGYCPPPDGKTTVTTAGQSFEMEERSTVSFSPDNGLLDLIFGGYLVRLPLPALPAFAEQTETRPRH